MENPFNPLAGGKERFRAKIENSLRRQKSEQAFLTGTSLVLAVGIILVTAVPKATSYFDRRKLEHEKKTDLVLVTSQPGAKIFWVF